MPSEYKKTRVSFDSRYRLTKIYQDDFISPGRRRLGICRFPDIKEGEFNLHTVNEVEEQRIDLISTRWYKDPRFWWVIALVNHLSDPLSQVTIGRVLKIPRLELVTSSMSRVVSR